jgi:hypothetical protein
MQGRIISSSVTRIGRFMQGPEETFAAYLVDQTRQDTDNVRDVHVRLSALPKRQPHRSQKDRGWTRFAACRRILWVTFAVYPIAKGMDSPIKQKSAGVSSVYDESLPTHCERDFAKPKLRPFLAVPAIVLVV